MLAHATGNVSKHYIYTKKYPVCGKTDHNKRLQYKEKKKEEGTYIFHLYKDKEEIRKDDYKGMTKERLLVLLEAFQGENEEHEYFLEDKNYTMKDDIYFQCLNCDCYNFNMIKEMVKLRDPNEERKPICAWCNDNFTKILNKKKYSISLENISILSDKIFDESYIYEHNEKDRDKFYNVRDEIEIWCGIEGHKPFRDIIGTHLKNLMSKKECKECNVKDKEPWKNNLDKFIRESKKKYGENSYSYELIKPTDLNNNKSKVKLICKRMLEGNICNKIFEVKIHQHIYKSQRCSCYEDKKQKMTYEIFVEKCSKVYSNGEFDFSLTTKDNFQGVDDKIYPICTKERCGYKKETTPRYFLNGGKKKCERCSNREVWNGEKLKRFCDEKSKEGLYSYNLVDHTQHYVGRDIIDIICLMCYNDNYLKEECIFSQRIIDHFVGNQGCPRCSGRLPWDEERLRCEIKRKEKEGEYSYEKVDYNNIDGILTKLIIACKKCLSKGYDPYFPTSIQCHFVHKNGCHRCGLSMPWDSKRFYEELARLPKSYTDSFDYSSVPPEIKGNTKLPIKCKICNQTFWRNPSYHITEMRGCTYCYKSFGSQMCFNSLKNLNIPFIDESQCEGMGDKCYYFDYKFEYKGNTYILEYDGILHHRRSYKKHKNEGDFESARLRDIHKQNLALKNGWKMIRIDHTINFRNTDSSINSINIEDHIVKALKELSETDKTTYYSTPSLYIWMEEGLKYYPNVPKYILSGEMQEVKNEEIVQPIDNKKKFILKIVNQK